MTKKKKPINTVSAEPVTEEHLEPEPAEELPVRQIEEPVEQPVEAEPVVLAESTSVVEPEPAPVEVVIKPEPEPTSPSKPKPLSLISLHGELDTLRQTVERQGLLITQLVETPTRQRKPPTSNGKVQIKDTLTGKIYPSKNNVYQSLLKAGELELLVKQGVFGTDPVHNSFGCYNLFRAYPGRFVEVKPQDAA